MNIDDISKTIPVALKDTSKNAIANSIISATQNKELAEFCPRIKGKF